MKRRTGFVSNSSSSSFIIALPKKPESKEDIRDFFFSDRDVEYKEWISGLYGDECYPVDKLVGTLFEDMTKPITIEKAVEIGETGYLDRSPDMDSYLNHATNEYDWDAYEKDRKEHSSEVMTKFMEENKGKVFFHYTYGDNDGAYFAMMEHSDFWSAVPFLRISHH